jgi:hypothetical protein
MFFPEELFILFASLAKIGQDGKAQFLDFNWILFLISL